MNKQEFLEQLRLNISTVNDYTFVNDTMAYYEDYIETEIRKGRSEEEVLAQLGDPRLIAKSILATCDADRESAADTVEDSRHTGGRTSFDWNGKRFRMPGWLFRLVTILVVFVVIILVFTLLSALAPYIMIGVVIYLLFKFIKNNFA